MTIANVEALLGVESADPRVAIIHEITTSRLLGRLKRANKDLTAIPAELDYIVDEVTIARFNRIGSEGITSESLDGHSATYQDNDFKPYEADITEYINRYAIPRENVVRFI